MDGTLHFYDRKLQIITKIAQYDINPGESHEGIWHVEGMPDEHIIMTATCYFEDDFKDCILEFRRDRDEKEQEFLMMIPDQNATIMPDYSTIYQHMGNLTTECGVMYAWANACQHRLLKITNKTNTKGRRSFIAFFLVDPDVKVVSTSDVPPQTYITKEKSMEYIKILMKERSGIKSVLNAKNAKEISYCEH